MIRLSIHRTTLLVLLISTPLAFALALLVTLAPQVWKDGSDYRVHAETLHTALIWTAVGVLCGLAWNLAQEVTVEQIPAHPTHQEPPPVHLSPSLRPVVPAEKSAKTTSTTSTKEPH